MRNLFLIIGLLITKVGFGQQAEPFSKIKLKDGAEYTARIIENHPGDHIMIKLGEGQSSKISYADIASIHDNNYRYQSEFSLPRGFFIEGAYALMFGKDGEFGEPRIGMSLGVTGNYRFNPYITLGAGLEVNSLYVNSNYLLVPIYGRLSGSFSENRSVPYYILNIGWSSASTGDMLEEDFAMKGGLFLRPEIGVRVNKVRIGVGYQIQQVETSYSNDLWWGDEQVVVEKRIMRNIRLGVSVLF